MVSKKTNLLFVSRWDRKIPLSRPPFVITWQTSWYQTVIIGPEFSFPPSLPWQILIFYRDIICFKEINDSDDRFIPARWNIINFWPLITNGLFVLVFHNKLCSVHCTYLGVPGYNFNKNMFLFEDLFYLDKQDRPCWNAALVHSRIQIVDERWFNPFMPNVFPHLSFFIY